MLAIQKYLREHGLEKTVGDFNLITRDYGHKILLKYSQIESNFSKEEVQDARGIVLEKDNWNVMSLAFRKFFNYGETHGEKIDWNTAEIFSKEDGSLVQLYYDYILSTWCVGTTGTADGSGLVNNRENMTFENLFYSIISNKQPINEFLSKLHHDLIYVCELMSPYNIVVTPHTTSKISLLSVRTQSSLEELNSLTVDYLASELLLDRPKRHNFKDFDQLLTIVSTLPYHEEGYVLCDAYFRRQKIKSPSYVAMHFLKGRNAEHNILTLVKQNEVAEFIATFPDRRNEILRLETNYFALIQNLADLYSKIESKYSDIKDKEQRKMFAYEVYDMVNKEPIYKGSTVTMKQFSGMFFAVKEGKTTIHEYVFNYDNKKLYAIL